MVHLLGTRNPPFQYQRTSLTGEALDSKNNVALFGKVGFPYPQTQAFHSGFRASCD